METLINKEKQNKKPSETELESACKADEMAWQVKVLAAKVFTAKLENLSSIPAPHGKRRN